MGTGQGNEVVGGAGEDDLEELQEAEAEIRDAAGEVEPPRPDKTCIEHLCYPVPVMFETRRASARMFSHSEGGGFPRPGR